MFSASVAVLRKLRFLAAMAIVISTMPLLANRPYVVNNDVAERLAQGAAPGQKLTFDHLPIIDGNPTTTIEVEQFEVWAPDAKITVHDANGVHQEAPHRRLFYRGRIPGVDDSMVFLSVDPANSRDMEGMVLIAERKFRIGRGVSVTTRMEGPGRHDDDNPPMLVREVDPYDDAAEAGGPWKCDTESSPLSGSHKSLLVEPCENRKVPGAEYTLRLAIETDNELFEKLGGTSPPSEPVEAYITHLVGAASTIYHRDLHTNLTIGHISVYATTNGNYTGLTKALALKELAARWHKNHCPPEIGPGPCTTEDADLVYRRSAVVLVSGKGGDGFIGGQATEGVGSKLITPSPTNDPYDNQNGIWGGAYAVVSSVDKTGTAQITPIDPNATVKYALPPDDKFAALSIFAHELGHLAGSPHTQCVAVDYGIYGRHFVDECATQTSGGCFLGNEYGAQRTNSVGACFTSGFGFFGAEHYCPAPQELGTIMSYCQYVYCPGGSACNGDNAFCPPGLTCDESGVNGPKPYFFPQSRYTFGQPNEASATMLDLFSNYLVCAAPDGRITFGQTPLVCVSGQTASVPSCTGCKYSWQLTGGEITSPTDGSSITITPSAGALSVTATVTVTTADGNGITTNKTVSTTCVSGSCTTPRHRATNIYALLPAMHEGSGYKLSVDLFNDEPGATVAWHAQDSLPDRQIGIGDKIHVNPRVLTTYWAAVTRVCDSTPYTTNSDAVTLTPTGNGHDTDLNRVISVGGIPKTYVELTTAGDVSSLSIPGDPTLSSTYVWRNSDQYNDGPDYPPLGTGTVYSATGPGLYWVRTTDSSGNITDSAVTRIVYHPSVPLDVFPGPGTVIGTEATIALTAHYLNYPLGTVYQWRQASELGDGTLFRNAGFAVLNSDTSNWVFHQSGIAGHVAYWVRVIPQGAQPIDSEPVLFTVACGQEPFVTILLNPTDTHVPSGRTISLFAVGFGRNVSYLWYRGLEGNVSNPIGSGGATINVFSPEGPYWVRATDDCGRSATGATTLYSCKPTISENGNPQDAYIGPGGSTTLTVTATPAKAGHPLFYQWYRGNIVWPIDGAVSSTYVVHEEGTYFATVSGDCDDGVRTGVQSAPATVLTCAPPVLGLTASHDMRLGTGQTLLVSTVGEALTYQWYNGVSPNISSPIADATTQTLYVQPNADSDYWVRVTDHGVCATNSATIHLTAVYPPTITTQPVGSSLYSGSTATLTVAATAATPAPLHYAWFEVGADGSFNQVAGNDSPGFTTPALTTSRTWFVRVYSGNQMTVYTDSQSATIHVCDVPEVHWSVFPHPLHVGDPFTLGISYAPEGFELYWYRGGVSGDVAHSTLIAGPTWSSLYLQLPPATVTATYWVRVKVGDCHADSPTMTLPVCAPTITQQPVDPPAINIGGTATLTVAATPGDITYQWYVGDSGDVTELIASAIGSSYAASPTVDTRYWVRVSGSCGVTADSSSALVTVCQVPHITANPSSTIVPHGGIANLGVLASGSNLTYQWYSGTAPDTSHPIDNLTSHNAVFTINPGVTTSYWVQVSGTCGTPQNSTTATVSVCPLVIQQPAAAIDTVMSGSTTTLTASGSEAPVYHWYQGEAGDTSHPFGGNTATVTTPAITAETKFWVMVSSGSCNVFSDTVTVHLCSPPAVGWATSPRPLRSGEPFSLRITAQPEGSQLYWYKGVSGDVAHSTLLAGPIDTSYYYQVVPTTPVSTYWVRVNTGSCYADSSTFTLNVCVPTITQQPAGAAITSGASTSLSVTANTSGLTYQWYIGDSGDITQPVANATGSSYTASPTADTRYWVRVTGSCAATADSDSALVTVCFPAAITNNGPSAQWYALGSGSGATLWVNATGNNLTYQWYAGTSGNTSAPLFAATPSMTVTPQNTASYWVRVSGSCGVSRDSTTMVVNVCGSPSITAQPQGSVIFSGGTATMSVTASEATTTPMSYQWYRGATGDTSAPVGTNSTSFTTPALTTPTSYWVRVSCAVCSPADSQAATVSMCNYPQVLAAPADQFIAIGQTATLPSYAGSGNVYQWYVGASGNTSQPAPGQSNLSSYTASPTVTTQYWVQIQNGGCISRTQSATVYVCVPTITQQPASIMINSGASASLSVIANTSGLTYQWYIGNSGTTTTPVSGATGSSVTVSPSATTNYWVRVTSSCSRTVDSATATVTICAPPVITYASPTQSIVRGGNAYPFVNATGSNLTYQWYVGTSGNTSAPISGATASTVTLTPQNTTSYWVRVSGTCGAVNSVTILVNVCATPSITTQPQGSIIFSGGTATMSVTASEATTTPMTYQWYRGATGDASAPVGTSSTSFTTPALTAQTSYWVRVSCGICNPADSQAATISICNYPQVLSSPGDFYNTTGQSVRLYAPNASGNTYQWYYGASGDTSHPYPAPGYYYADVAPTVTTQYWAQVQSGGCISRTATANVYVCVPTITQQPASVTIAAGSSTTLTVSANTAGVTYQWYVGASGNTGAPIGGATGASVTVTPGANTSYWARAISSCGRTVDSATATVTLCSPTVITGQPNGSTLWGSGTAYMWVYASGSNITYQWYFGNSGDTSNPISGATDATSAVWIGATQKVWVRVTGQCGTVNSNATYVSIRPNISQQPPDSLQVGYNATASLSLYASGSYMSYVWKNAANGTVIATTTTPTLITGPITADINIYCEVWSGNGVSTTNGTVLHVCYNAPNISIAKAPNGSCSIGYATSYGADDYQWYQGARGDISHLVGSGSPYLYVCPTTATQYWLRSIVYAPDQTVSCYSDSNVITMP